MLQSMGCKESDTTERLNSDKYFMACFTASIQNGEPMYLVLSASSQH